MNSATKTKASAATEAQHIPLERLHPAPWNEERPIDDGYVQSFREKGQLVTAMVRPHPAITSEFEIVYGHRRAAALKAMDAETMRCEVRDIPDEEAEELGAIENAQRAGLTWQQLCRLIEGYLSRHLDEDAPARIGSALGISTAQVKRRARMLSNLSPSWLDAISGAKLPAWTVEHFEILTIFDEKRQEGIFKDLQYSAAGLTLQELREEISSSSESLKAAPFDIEDETLFAKAGACTGCPKRSDVQLDLLGQVDGKVKATANCLDVPCYKRKVNVHMKRKEETLREKHPDAIKVTTDWNMRGKDILRSNEFEPAKKGDKGAVPAIQVSTGGKVSQTYVKVKKERAEKQKDPVKAAAEKRQQRIDALALEKLSAYVKASDKDEFTKQALPLLTQFCLLHGVEVAVKGMIERRIMAFDTEPVTVQEIWPAAQKAMIQELRSIGFSLDPNNFHHDKRARTSQPDVKLIAWIVDADFATMRAEAEAEVKAGPNVNSATAEDQDEQLANDNGLVDEE